MNVEDLIEILLRTRRDQNEENTMNKKQAIYYINSKTKNINLVKHMLALGACMKGLAKYFGENEEKWEIAGILHDVDFETTQNDLSQHPIMGAEWLKEKGVEKEIVDAVLAHAWGYLPQIPEPKNRMEWAMFCTDHLTGLIIAVTLIRPERKINLVTVENIMKKWNKKDFAKGTKRENIAMCEEKLGIKLEDFVGVCLESMKGISEELEL